MKGKWIYNRFVRAISEITFIILLVAVIMVMVVGSQVITMEMLDGSEDFYDSELIYKTVNNYSSIVSNSIYSYVEEYYMNNNVNEEEISSQVFIYYSGEYYEHIIEINEGDIISAIQNAELQNRLKNCMDRICKNYAFSIRYKDEILFSTMENEENYEYINTTVHHFNDNDMDKVDNLFVDNYVRSNIVEGDDFYRCQKWYYFFNDNISTIMVLGGIAILLVIILGVYIILTAGYNQNGELEVSWLDNIPLELYALITFIYLFLMMSIASDSEIMDIIISAISIVVMIGILMLDVKTILSRLKNKIFVKSSLCGKMMLFTFKEVKKALKDIDKKWKAVLIVGGVFLCEGVVVIIFIASDYAATGFGEFIWIVIKILQFVLIMCLYTDIAYIRDGVKDMCEGHTDKKIDTAKMNGVFRQTAEYINDISDGLDRAVEEKLKSEQLKTELITNVSHDIKTPLTSIINYIDLMKKENIENTKIKEYIAIVDKQSMRLKKLTEDVIEASKAATGNISVEMGRLNICEMIAQSLGEYEAKFTEKSLTVVYGNTEASRYVWADGRLLWRVVENLFSNIYKYALEGTRLYIDISEQDDKVLIIMKNVSKYQLNISSDELMQRFVRGDSSRTTSGNGLGLSIAESLTKLQNGTLDIEINGDLFISILSLKKADSEV